MAKNALERQDDAFSGRPDFHSTQIVREFNNNEESMEFGPFNVAYLKQRKLTAYALRKFNMQGDYIQDLILGEAQTLVEKLLSRKGALQSVVVEVTLSTGCVIYQVLFGKGGNVREDEQFKKVLQNQDAFTNFVGSGNATDVLPWLRIFLRKKMKNFLMYVSTTDKIMWQKVDEHKNIFHSEKLNDVTDVFLAAQLPGTVKNKETEISEARQLLTLCDLLGAGFATTSTTLLWLILYMTAYPEIQRKVQIELDTVIGSENVITLKDRSKLHYTNASITEVLRVCNIAPLALPHFTTMDTTLNGYHIDKGTVVLVNLDSVNKDETVWENPTSFIPGRHLNENNEFEKRNKVYSFGLGRRRESF
ncbi:MAG: cytochrome P450 [Candidatus Thiodiazotropha sp.]